MKPKRAVVAVVSAALVAQLPPSPVGADPIVEQRAKVRSAEAEISKLQKRLATILGDTQSLKTSIETTHGALGQSIVQIGEMEIQVEKTRQIFNTRAREAYKRGGWLQATVLLRVRTLAQVLSVSRILGKTIRQDVSAYEGFILAREELVRQKDALELQKQDLLTASAKMASIRREFQSALNAAQRFLSTAKAELVRLEEERRRQLAAVSPAVEARRTARQAELDRKLAAVLAWYAPGMGAEPYMPEQFSSTEIVTTGLASWYGPGFDGRRASSGATYNMNQLTAASLVLPFGTFLKVTLGGKAVIVVITDRGPYVAGRVLDLSLAGAQAIGLSGVKTVRMEVLVPSTDAPPFP